jgi:hypothetical protein
MNAMVDPFNRLRAPASTLDALTVACPGDGELADALATVSYAILTAVEEIETKQETGAS